MAVTPNRGLTIINGASDLLSAGDDVINANSTILDKATVLLQGTFASRPVQPHPVGVMFQPTDLPGYLYLSTGTQWLEVAPGAGAAPIGSMMDWAGSGDVAGGAWLLCDGRSLLRTDFNNLFTALGGAASPWGLADATHFNLPDFRGRVVVGQDNMGTATGPANRLVTTANKSRGQSGGAESHTHTANVPNHSHSATIPNHTHSGGCPDHLHGAPSVSVGNAVGWPASGQAAASAGADPYSLARHAHSASAGQTGASDRSLAFTTGNPNEGGASTKNFNTGNPTSATVAITNSTVSTLEPYAVANRIIRAI